jgi:WhiB family redox-sensing transcriptional regulator
MLMWRELALCAETDPEFFFPEGPATTVNRARKKAAQVCARCPVKLECYEFAFSQKDIHHGIWGGVEAGEIRRHARQRAAATRR